MMELRLFGPVELRRAGELLDVGTPRQQAVLAALAVDAGRPVPIDTLVDRVWGEAPPAEARNVLYSHLSRIRRLLGRLATGADGERGPPRIVRRHAGYVLELDPEVVDVHRFRRLVERAAAPDRADAERIRLLDEALALWRGTPLAGVPGEWAAQVRGGWHQRRLAAVTQWAEAQLAAGDPGAVSATLPELVAEYPLAEPLEAMLMRALHAQGRAAEAVDRYATVRERLADQLGTDPSAELRTLHQAILRGDPLPPQVRPGPGPVPAGVPHERRPEEPRKPLTVAPPAQLPPDTPGFAGRDDELRRLDRHLTEAESRSTAVVISAVSGTAGVGKTALAIHWAHRVRDRFPDGQLYVDLQGFDPSGTPVAPAEAVRAFVEAFGVPPERVPESPAAQVGLYRTVLADRRVLIVLDNARDAEQVRPLLPGAPRCLVVVTSRNRLSGLVAEGADPLTLDLLTVAGARELLSRRLGTRRVAAEPEAVDEMVASCARLPLALAVAAARAAAHPRFRLTEIAGELRASRHGLDAFADADPATDPRAVFTWSYRQLGAPAARLFRLLGLHPGPDIDIRAAASLAGVPAAHVRRTLAELAAAHLVAERSPGRYAFHDLLRAYAAELADTHETEAERHAARHRLLDHYVHSAYRADHLLNPHRDDPTTLDAPAPGVHPEPLDDRDQAIAWFVAEHSVLSTVVRQVAGFDAHLWQLAWALTRYFAYHGQWHDSVSVLGAALEAARRLGDPLRQAFAHRFLGAADIRLGRFDDARDHLRAALDLYQDASEHTGEAHAHRHYAWLLERQGHHREALSHAERAHDLFQLAGHRPGLARSLNAIGWFHAKLGDHRQAITYCRLALQLQGELGDRFGQAETWDSLGYAHHHLGHHAEAITCYRTAIDLYQEFDDQYNEADTAVSLGDVHDAAGDLESARAAWLHALGVLERLGHPGAEAVRARLGRPTSGPQSGRSPAARSRRAATASHISGIRHHS